MDVVVVGVSVILGLTTLVYLYLKWKHSYWKRRGVPQLPTNFIYGNAKDMIKGDKSIAETYLEFYRNFKANGVKYGGIYLVVQEVFVPIDPDLIKDMMQKNFEYFAAHSPKVRKPTILNKGVFHLEGEPWRNTRKKLTPSFTSGKMKMMFETLLEKTNGLKELAGEIADSGEPADIRDVLARFTTDVVGSCGFGLECNSLKDPDSEFLKYGRTIFSPPETKENYWGIFLRALNFKRFRKDLRPACNFFKKIVEDTITYREKNKIYRKDFMHLMIQLKNRGVITDDEEIFDTTSEPGSTTFDADEVAAQCMIFFIAGYETSSTTTTFAILELAQNQEIQDKVREEANEVLKKYNGKMTYEAMLELKYAERVIEETLRKIPPAAVIPRVCTKRYVIPGTSSVIEPGTVVHIPAWGLHMDPDFFPDPEKFDPERFSEENRKNIKEFTYLPFGEGPRMCLGLRFGLMQSKVGLVSLVRNYRFTLNKKTSLPIKMLRNTFITTVDGDVWVDIKRV